MPSISFLAIRCKSHKKMVYQVRYILLVFAERRDIDWHNVQTVIRDLREMCLLPAPRADPDSWRRSYVMSTFQCLGPAQAARTLAPAKHAAALPEWLLAHRLFRREKACLYRPVQTCPACCQSPSKGSPLKTEEFALEERVWNGGAVDFDERSGGAPRILVNRPCDQVFANATLAANEHCRIRGRHALHQCRTSCIFLLRPTIF